MSAIALDGLHLDYPGGNTGLRDIDLHIADGEFLALVGPWVRGNPRPER